MFLSVAPDLESLIDNKQMLARKKKYYTPEDAKIINALNEESVKILKRYKHKKLRSPKLERLRSIKDIKKDYTPEDAEQIVGLKKKVDRKYKG